MSGETETAPTTEETAEETVSAADAEAWLNATKPVSVLALLKDPDFRAAVTPAFAGFQPNARSLSLPFVRNKLVQIAVKDDKFAEKLRSLSESSTKPLPVSAEAKPATPISKPELLKLDPLLALRAERDARRKERDAARQALAEAQSALDTAVKLQVKAEAERDESRQAAKKQSERLARLERQAAKAKQLEARLVRALNEDKVSPAPATRQQNTGPKQSDTAPVSAAWPAAVRHLLDKAKFDTALALAEDVLKTDAEDTDALQIALRAYEGRKEPRQAFGMARRLLAARVQRTQYPAAAEALGALLRLAASPGQAEPDVRLFFAAFPASDSGAVSAVRLLLSRLRGSNPGVFQWLTGYLETRTALGPVLMPPPGAVGADDPLPSLPLRRPVTARQLVEAIDRAQTALVDAARPALQALEAADGETFARVWAALEQAASDEPLRLLPLRRLPRGAAVVDGSNVAWFDQESLSQGHPRLRPLLAVRRALWAKGFFPVLLYADANLPYFIDDKPALIKMRDRQELSFVDAGTAADEVLLRVAKQMGALLVTNDKMEDWDPEHTVRKVRYTVSMSGEAHLLSEI